MKAISIKEPWASLINSGKKTIETRNWKTKYRGRLLLCCSKKPVGNLSGLAFAICDLVEIRPMKIKDEYLAGCAMYPEAYSWVLENVKPIFHFPVKGKLGLFEVDCENRLSERNQSDNKGDGKNG